MSKKENEKYSTHHILPRSMWGKTESKNLIELKDNYHRALHTLFANQMIAEQLITTVNISSKALREDVKQWLLETLNSRDIEDPYEWYNPKVIRF